MQVQKYNSKVKNQYYSLLDFLTSYYLDETTGTFYSHQDDYLFESQHQFLSDT